MELALDGSLGVLLWHAISTWHAAIIINSFFISGWF
jgi:hypothetical protein